jgi:hypothetical protein
VEVEFAPPPQRDVALLDPGADDAAGDTGDDAVDDTAGEDRR